MRKQIVVFAALAAMFSSVVAQEFPSKPIRLVVPFPPGGGTDVVSRMFAHQLSEIWKQPIITDNKPGANTIIASDFVSKAPGDGYTWLIASPSHTVNVSLYAKTIPYNTERDFVAASMIASGPLVLLAHPSVPANNIKELIELAKKNPGSIRYGSAGTGSSPHLAGAMFAQMAGVKMEHVPYKGTAPSIADLLGGHIQITFTPLPGMTQYIETGKLKALAVTTDKRFPSLPNLPTVSESGLKGFNISQWWGIVVPKNTPQSAIQRIDAGVKLVQKRLDIQKNLLDMGAEVKAGSPADLEAHIQQEIVQYRKLVETAHITPD